MNANSPSTSSLSTNAEASAEAISRRAYELWEQEGRPEGCDLRHWLQAEKELGTEPQNGTPSSHASGNGVPSIASQENRPLTDTQPLQTGRPVTNTTPGRDTKRPPGAPMGGEKPPMSSGRRK